MHIRRYMLEVRISRRVHNSRLLYLCYYNYYTLRKHFVFTSNTTVLIPSEDVDGGSSSAIVITGCDHASR